jgi:hypothetical protein
VSRIISPIGARAVSGLLAEKSASGREKLVDRILNGNWTMTAANRLMGKLLDMDALDMADGEIDIEGEWLDRKITDNEFQVMNMVRSQISALGGIQAASAAGRVDISDVSAFTGATMDGDLGVQAYEEARDYVLDNLEKALQGGKTKNEFFGELKEQIIDPKQAASILRRSRL